METVRFTAELWRWSAQDSWFFVTVPEEESDLIRDVPSPRRGFGSVRVRATAGTTTWTTSVFPDSKSGCYVLPVKKAVRTAVQVDEGDPLDLELELLEWPASGPTPGRALGASTRTGTPPPPLP